MSLKRDRILVIDIEATCWDGKIPPGEESEIIEIGIATLEITSGQPLEKDSILVQPTRSTVSEFCTELTTLTPAQVNQGISLAEACQILQKKYHAPDRIWASYGEYDRTQFTKQCQAFGIKYPFNPRHINVKNLFAIIYDLPKEVGMNQALEMLNIPLEGTHHRGIDDAWNIAKILSHLILKARNPNFH
jgi:inhibitor of KinA sporulation pathway (predicted exonuclease)